MLVSTNEGTTDKKNDILFNFYGLCGVVVKTPAWESMDPMFKSRLTVHRKRRCLLHAFVINNSDIGGHASSILLETQYVKCA